MLRVFQLCVALLTVSNAFRGTVSRAQLKSCNIAMALNRDDDITPKLARDGMIQPMQRGKISFERSLYSVSRESLLLGC